MQKGEFRKFVFTLPFRWPCLNSRCGRTTTGDNHHSSSLPLWGVSQWHPVRANVFTTDIWGTARLIQALGRSFLQQYYFTWNLSFHLLFSLLCMAFYFFSPNPLLKFTCVSSYVPLKTFFLKKHTFNDRLVRKPHQWL